MAASINQRTYNELVSELVTVLGSETPKSLLTPQRSGISQGSLSELARRQSSGVYRLTLGVGSGGAPAQSLSRAGSGTEAASAAVGSMLGLQAGESTGAAAASVQQKGQGGRGAQAPLADAAEAPLIDLPEAPEAAERQHSAGANRGSQALMAMQPMDAQSGAAQHQVGDHHSQAGPCLHTCTPSLCSLCRRQLADQTLRIRLLRPPLEAEPATSVLPWQIAA